MYKLFLTLRYLTRKKIVIFPILVVWLCLMMMIIVTSIMGGFVERVRIANRDLQGDVVISTKAAAGFPFYEELEAELRKKVPEIQAATPVVRGYGLATFPYYPANAPAQVVGIDPVGRSKVSRFQENLYRQSIAPRNAAEDLAQLGLPKNTQQLQQAALQHYQASLKTVDEAIDASQQAASPIAVQPLWLLAILPTVAVFILLERRGRKNRSITPVLWGSLLLVAGLTFSVLAMFWPVLFPRELDLRRDAFDRARLASDRAESAFRFAEKLPPDTTFRSLADLTTALVPKAPSLAVPPDAALAVDNPNAKLPPDGCIVGVQFGLFQRDRRGNFDRISTPAFQRVLLTIVPISGKGTVLGSQANTRQFTMVDDSYSGVYDVDSSVVYAPFEIVQSMAGLRSELPKDDPDYTPPRANEILFKITNADSRAHLYAVRQKMAEITGNFIEARRDEGHFFRLEVETWDQRQAKYLGAVQNEKKMMTFIIGLMSLVVLVVIFLIFYMIVRDKTKDIGIIKAVGGSEAGVLTIFLLYGLFIGVVGGGLGVISGVAFVTHTNEIHEWLFQAFGIVIWDRSVYLFDRIPDTVNTTEVGIYYVLAMIAGLVGAAIPAAIASWQDPVRAVRYE